MLRGHERFSEGPVMLINRASDKASAGSPISRSIQEGEGPPTCIRVAQPDRCSFDGAALPCCGNTEKRMKGWCSELGIGENKCL